MASTDNDTNVLLERHFGELNTKLSKESTETKKEIELLTNRALTAEKQLKELEAQVEVIKTRAGLGVSLPGVDEGKNKFSFQRALAAINNNDWTNAGYESEVIKETKKRAVQQASTDSLGGFLIPIQVSAEMIGELRNQFITSQLGCRVLANLPFGIYKFNKKKSHATAAPKSELGAAQRTGMTFGQMSLDPKIIAAYVPTTEVLLNNSNPSIEAMIREDLRLALLERMETGFFFGNGGDNDVLGISRQPGVLGNNNTGFNAGDNSVFQTDFAAGHELTHEDIINILEAYISDNNAMPSNPNIAGGAMKLVANPGVRRLFRTAKYWTFDATSSSSATKLNLPFRSMGFPLTNDQVESTIGYPIVDSNIIPIAGANQGVQASTISNPTAGTSKLSFGFFGNWAEIYLALFEGMSIYVSRDASDVVSGKFYSAFTQGQVWIRATMMYATGVRHEEAMIILNNLLTRRA